jgi:hypothetical protein
MNDLMTEKKKYIKPITESFPMIEEVFTTNSVEYHKEIIDDNNDDCGDDVEFGV